MSDMDFVLLPFWEIRISVVVVAKESIV